jgi:hypothetical protein
MSSTGTEEGSTFRRSFDEAIRRLGAFQGLNVILSSSISSSNSTSPGSKRWTSISPLASCGRLKLVLLLELPLPGRPDEEDGLPILESDVRREEGPEVSA